VALGPTCQSGTSGHSSLYHHPPTPLTSSSSFSTWWPPPPFVGGDMTRARYAPRTTMHATRVGRRELSSETIFSNLSLPLELEPLLYSSRTGRRRTKLVELACAGCNHDGAPSRVSCLLLHALVNSGRSSWSSHAPAAALTDLQLACCPLLSARWSAILEVKLRQPPADAIRRMRTPRMQ
jgi:hypothetical protein